MLVAALAAFPLLHFLWDWSQGFDHLLVQYLADDAFYYFEISRHPPEFNHGIPTSGFHPLYVLLIAPLHQMLSYEYAVPLSLLVLVLANCACVVAVHRLLASYWSEPLPLLCATAWALNGKMYSLAMTGVETILAVLGVLLVLLQHARLVRDGIENAPASRYAALGALVGATFLARMDSPLVLAPFITLLVLQALRRGLLVRVGALVGALAAVSLPWLVFMRVGTGSFFPTSGLALRVLAGIDGVFASQRLIQKSLIQFITRFGEFLTTTDVAHGVAALGLLAFAAGVGAVFLARSSRLRDREFARFCALLFVGLACWSSYYVLFQAGFRRWYFAYVGLAVFALLLPLALSALYRIPALARSRVSVAVILVGIVSLLARPAPTAPQEYDKFRAALAADAILTRENPPGRIGSFNAGVYNYFMSRDVINLDGVVNPEALEALRSDTLADYIEAKGIGILIEHDLGQARHVKQITREQGIELERWIDLTQYYPGYQGHYAKRTYLWKIRRARRTN